MAGVLNLSLPKDQSIVECRIPDMLERMIVTGRLIIDSWDVRIFMYIEQVAGG